ncbi:TPA: hypothetical protein ACQ2H1_003856, partial [Klebsiella pneumoniae]
WWGGAHGGQTGVGFMMDFLLNAVTNLLLRSGPVAKRWELSLVLPNRRDRQVAARTGILRSLSTGQAMNRLCVYRIY